MDLNNKNKRVSWTKERIDLLTKYKNEGLSVKEIASLMNSTKLAISCACTEFRILLDPELRQKRYSEAAIKGIKNKIKKYNLTETTPVLLDKIHELKNQKFANDEIAKKLSIPLNSVNNLCFKYRILLDEKSRKKKLIEAGIKGGAIFKKKRQDLAKIHSFNGKLGYIIGACFGDGSAIELDNKSYLELRVIDESFAKTFYNALLDYTTQKPNYYIYVYDKHFKKENRLYKNVKYHEIFFNNTFFVRNLLNIFGSTKNWKVDVDQFISYGREFCIGFVKGMFDSEGCFWIQKKKETVKGHLEFSSVNKDGTLGFYKLLKILGYDFRLNSFKKKNGVLEFKIRSCKLSLIKKYFSEIGFSIDRKQERLENFIKLRNL